MKCRYCNGSRMRIVVVVMTMAVAIMCASASYSQDLLVNGDFENWTNGVPDVWRWYAVSNADGSISKTTDTGTYSSGQAGALLTWNNNVGDSGLDRWDTKIPTYPSHIYKYLVDAKTCSGEKALYLQLSLCDSSGNFLEARSRSMGSYLTNDFQTFGWSARANDVEALICPRVDVRNSGAGASTYVDNARLIDVTTGGNRMLNGDFENSATQPLHWRFANVGDGSGTVGLSRDAYSGSNAAFFTVTTAPTSGDIVFDNWDDTVLVNGSEPLLISFDAKQLSGGNGVGLWYEVVQINAAGVPMKANEYYAAPGTDGYSAFSQQIITEPTAAYVCISFRISDASFNRQAGSYLIDDVYVGAPTNLLTNGDFEDWSYGVPNNWRWYAVANAAGSISQTTEPGTYTSGQSGVLLTWNNKVGDSSLDRWDTKLPVSLNHIYKYLVDAKAASGENALNLSMDLCDVNGGFLGAQRMSFGSYLTNSFQTFGCSARALDSQALMSIRADVGNSGAGSSTYLDNARLIDVTSSGNRLFNGDFENSTSQLLQWRFANVGDGSGTVGINHDANSGSNAVLLTVTSAPTSGDITLDIWNDTIQVNGSEPLFISFAAKKLSGQSDAGIWYQVLQYDTNGVPFKATDYFAAPGTNGYTTFTQQIITEPNSGYACISFRISDANLNRQAGSYLIDSVYLGAPNLTTPLTPTAIQLSDIETMSDGALVQINGSIVSDIWNDYFYIEKDNRTVGLRVQKPSHGLIGINLRATVAGRLCTNTATGERYLDATTAVAAGTGSVTPLGISNKSLSGYRPVGAISPAPNNIGLLVRTWGKVVDVDSSTIPTWLLIDDGSGTFVKCVVPAGVTIDPMWDYVGVTGISSAQLVESALQPVILVSQQSDITPYF